MVNANEGEVVEGGSTITQQLVKNLYVGSADTLRRKLDEASLAWQLEDRLSKDQILTQVPEHGLPRRGCLRRAVGGADLLLDRRATT